MNWLYDLRIEDLPEIYQEVAELKGLQYAVSLAEYFGGRQVYFPQTETLFKKAKERYIIEKFNGNNHTALASATGLCEREIYTILKEHRERSQLPLFSVPPIN
jgi:Mor family transcriptional regulator